MNFEKPLTCLITKGELKPGNFEQRKREILETVRASSRAGISMFQIREKRISAKQLFELTREAVSILRDSKMKLLVNGRPDVAAAAGAHGVHLPENGLPVAAVRRTFSTPFLIGTSVHSSEAARCASNDGADFILFGPVFNSGEKKGKGLNESEEICRELSDLPVIAVGGIDHSNFEKALAAGARGYAAIRYLNHFVSER